MNKKNIFFALALAAMSTLAFTSCDKSAPKADDKNATAAAATNGAIKIAYVEMDSITTQYTFCKDQSLVLQKKGQNIENTLTQKQQQLEAAVANFQQKLQQNAYTREQAEAIQSQLQRQESDLRTLSQRLQTEFQNEQVQFQNAILDSINNYIAVYNKDKKYNLILVKSTILYADKAYDITNEVIAGLNKAYKPAKPAAETKKK